MNMFLENYKKEQRIQEKIFETIQDIQFILLSALI